MNKGIIFILGCVVGAVAGSLLTYRKVIQAAEDDKNREIEGMRDYYDYKLEKLEAYYNKDEEAEEEPAKELSKSSYSDYIKEHETDEEDPENKLRYHKVTSEDKPAEAGKYNTVMKLISEEDYDAENGHNKETLFLFDTDEEDQKIVVDEDEVIISFANCVQKAYDEWRESDESDEDELYLRDVATNTDYKVLLRPEEYYKGVVDDILGEE